MGLSSSNSPECEHSRFSKEQGAGVAELGEEGAPSGQDLIDQKDI